MLYKFLILLVLTFSFAIAQKKEMDKFTFRDKVLIAPITTPSVFTYPYQIKIVGGILGDSMSIGNVSYQNTLTKKIDWMGNGKLITKVGGALDRPYLIFDQYSTSQTPSGYAFSTWVNNVFTTGLFLMSGGLDYYCGSNVFRINDSTTIIGGNVIINGYTKNIKFNPSGTSVISYDGTDFKILTRDDGTNNPNIDMTFGVLSSTGTKKNAAINLGANKTIQFWVDDTLITQIEKSGYNIYNPLKVTGSVSSGYMLNVENLANYNSAGGIVLKAGSNTEWSAVMIGFKRPDNGTLGYIAQNSGSSVQYYTSSDSRVKSGIVPTRSNIQQLMNIKVRDYSFIGESVDRTGFIAQELYDVVPEAVKVGGDDPRTEPWGIDYSKVVPLTVKAVQELYERVLELEKKVASLENR